MMQVYIAMFAMYKSARFIWKHCSL